MNAEHVKVLEELDALLDMQGRLLFSRENYNEVEAERFGVMLLDFMRRHGVMVRAAIAALNPWQPIETAPKDGTRILTCVLGSDGRAYDYQINEWNDPRAVADGNGIGSVGWWSSRPSRQPTHWHPLTTPPAGESANG